MIVTPLSVRGAAAVRDALLSHGWEGDLARLTADGLEVAAFHVSGVRADAIETMVPLAARLGLEIVSGDDWLLLAGGRSRLGAFARPWVQPEPVRALADAIGLAMPAQPPVAWRHARGTLSLDRPTLMGIVNATPDSFSPPSRSATVDEALAMVDTLLAAGATIVDVGGESTRPGATPITAAEELDRVVPTVAAIAARHPDLVISIDTVRAATAEAAVDAGAAIINDVMAGRHDAAVHDVAARSGAGLVLTHSRGALGALATYDHARYDGDVVTGVVCELVVARDAALAAGVAAEAIALDPGFGFAKTPAQNVQLLAGLDAIVALGHPVLVGVSRKRFLGELTGAALEDRDRATAAACAVAAAAGATLFRVHDPGAARDAVTIAHAVRRAGQG